MIKESSPIIGVLLILGMASTCAALDCPREVLLEVDRPVEIQAEASGIRTSLPDLDALLSQYPSTETRHALNSSNSRFGQFKNFLLIRLPKESDKLTFLRKASQLASVRWAQSNHLLRSHFTPNDPYFSSQWGLQRVGAQAAWDISRGDAAIPIGIIDTGCQMDHPDLISSFWSNLGEDADSNGVLDANDLDGIDGDGNGFVDDFHGWDFVDAPTFPSNGDYLVRDNDPSDEMGHGTAVAGICGAIMDNGVGVAGLAPECPLMILRAGNMNGYLQEDDVASAILYALDNGARVINMSFGDTEASPMLEDVINYAAQGGLMMVAASGNYGSSGIIYPAAFGPILCVGASDEEDGRATFSSYGTALDLLAPGTNIFSTIMGYDYGPFQGGNGTSFATAFASAAAGLVLSSHPSWDAPTVASVLKSTCDDVSSPGWDAQTGQGILRIDRALEVEEALVANITQPTMAQSFAAIETLRVEGTAAGAYLKEYIILTGLGENPAEWDTIVSIQGIQVIGSWLADIYFTEPIDTAYTIRLDARDHFGNTVDDRAVIYLDPSPPEISNIALVPILDGERPCYLLTFNTDDKTTGKVWLQAPGGTVARWISLTLNYESTDHVVLIGKDLDPENYAYYVWAQNASGLVDSTNILDTLDLTQLSIATNNFVEQPPTGIPPGYLYEEATDLDEDNFLEIWQDTLDANGSKSDLRVWEATSNWAFSDLGDSLGLDFGKQIPKSIGDSDADEKAELLTLYAGVSKIFEATATSPFPQPNNVIWSSSEDVWGAKLLDLDPGGNQGEVLLFSEGTYKLWAHYPNNPDLSFIQSLPNPFSATPTFVPPYCRVGDYDDDTMTELLFGDYDGHLYIYEQLSSGLFQVSWMDSVPLLDTGEFLSDGDYDGDGLMEFAVLAHTETVLAGEHLADTRYWALYVFKTTGFNQYAPMDTLYFFGAQNPAAFPSGISSGDVFGNSNAEILLCLFPHLYVVAWDSLSEGFSVIWYFAECRSNKAVVGDFDRNGHNDFLFNSGTETRSFEAVGSWSQYPPPPLGFQAVPEEDRVNLSWLPVEGAESYELRRYQGSPTAPLDTLIEVFEPQRTHTDFVPPLIVDTTYYYTVRTIDLSSPTPAGPPTVPVAATPNFPPFVLGDTAHFTAPNFVTVDFNEAMGLSLLDVNNYWIAENSAQPRSAIADWGGKRAVLTFDPVFEDTTYRMIIHELYDLQGSPLSTLNDTLYFTVTSEVHSLPYLVSARVMNDYAAVELLFSQPMDRDDLENEANYVISVDPASPLPALESIIINNAVVDSAGASMTVVLLLSPDTPLRAAGIIYRVTASNLHTPSGLEIDSTHNSTTLTFLLTNLGDAYVFPNPYSINSGVPYVIFANLTLNTEIRILTLSGILIRKIKTSDNFSHGVSWDLRNERGEPVGSGIYLYYISGDGDTIWGKLAVVR